MPKIIKSHQVNISDDFHTISVPEKKLFSQIDYEDDYSDEEQTYIDPEEIIRNSEKSAEEIIENARGTAAQILEEAKQEAESHREAIFEEARSQGYEKGLKEAQVEGREITAKAEKTLSDALAEKEKLLKEVEPEAVAVVIDTIEKLVGDIVYINPGAIMHIIKTGIEGAPGAKQLFIRVSSDDYETAANLRDEVLAYVDSDTEIDIIKDASLGQGDCVIDTPIGSVDSSLKTQWEGLKNDLLQILKAR